MAQQRGRDLGISCDSLLNPDASIVSPDFDNDTMYNEDNEFGNDMSQAFK